MQYWWRALSHGKKYKYLSINKNINHPWRHYYVLHKLSQSGFSHLLDETRESLTQIEIDKKKVLTYLGCKDKRQKCIKVMDKH